MKQHRIWIMLTAACVVLGSTLFCFITACKEVPENGGNTKEPEVNTPEWEIPADYDNAHISDMALIYGGGKQRKVVWNEESFAPHVVYTDNNDNKYWLFDSYLMIEFTLAKGGADTNQILATGYYGLPARKQEWQELLDYFFSKNLSIDALDKAVGEQIEEIGYPEYRRQVILAIPEPIVGGPGSYYTAVPANYWGAVDGRQLDFTKEEDRLAACEWYVDRACEMFDEQGYENVELAGFYWVAEQMETAQTIIKGVAEHIQSKGLRLEWIPYWKAGQSSPDYFHWKEYGFDKAYLQPNYFFSEVAPAGRLEDAIEVITNYDLGYEIEFDERAIIGEPDGTEERRQRLYDYMASFKNSGVYGTQPMAYYMGEDAFIRFSNAELGIDRQTFDDFCTFVFMHQRAYLKNRK